jgi:hypothetical protein
MTIERLTSEEIAAIEARHKKGMPSGSSPLAEFARDAYSQDLKRLLGHIRELDVHPGKPAKVTKAPRSGVISHVCDRCKRPVADRKADYGYVFVLNEDVRAAQESARADAERIRLLRETSQGGIISFRDLCGDAEPLQAKWQTLHADCDEAQEPGAYWIGIERISDQKQVISWCAHFVHKQWVPLTNWAETLRRWCGGAKFSLPG